MTASMLETCRAATVDHIIENGLGYGLGALFFGALLYVLLKTRTPEKNRKRALTVVAALCLYCVAGGLIEVGFATYDLCTNSYVYVEEVSVERVRNASPSAKRSELYLKVTIPDEDKYVRLDDSDLFPKNASKPYSCSVAYSKNSRLLLYLKIHS